MKKRVFFKNLLNHVKDLVWEQKPWSKIYKQDQGQETMTLISRKYTRQILVFQYLESISLWVPIRSLLLMQ